MNTYIPIARWKSALATVALALPLAVSAGFAPYPFTEDFETWINTNYWTLQGTWGPTWEAAHSGNNSFTDSPWTTYAPNQDSSANLGVDLRFGAIKPVLSFWQRYAFEPGQDYGFVEVSRDQGATWTSLLAVTGMNSAWQNEQIDLSYYAGAQVLIRFRLLSDGQNQYDGWYIDDLTVAENTAPSVYPFHDSVDTAASLANWLPSAWEQVAPGHQGTGMSWNCQIGNGHQPGPDLNAYLTLAQSLNLGKAVNPKLSFWWRAGSQGNNQLFAQASSDGGKTWSSLWSWSSYWYQSAAWSWQQVDLNAYVGSTNLELRFLAYQSAPGNPFGIDFSVDDARIDEAPTDLAVSIGPGADSRHNALLTWAASPCTNFAYYAIYRSTSPNITPNNLLVAAISNQSTVSFQDTNLPLIAQTYYYRVLVWNALGLHNWGTNDLSYQTTYGQMVATYPVVEGFETGNAHWALDQPWAISTQMSHSGANCLASNPGTNYADNADLSAYLSLDLSKANRPALSFWERYGFEPNQDFGFVELSLNQGATWNPLYAVTGQSGTNWVQAQVSLDGYAGAQVLVRFRLLSDGQNPYNGWFIDDVQVQDLAKVFPYPFSDAMDTTASQSNWLASVWQPYQSGVTTNGADMSWRALIGNGAQPGPALNAYFTLAGSLNLGSAVNPKLWFWWRAGSQGNNQFYPQVSTDGGKTWTSLSSWSSYWYQSAGWTPAQLDLKPYAGATNVSFRFLAAQSAPGNPFGLDFSVDDVVIGEQAAPAPNVTATIAPGPDPRYSASLSWQASMAPDFAYYAIYRSTSPTPTTSSLLVAALSNRSLTSFTDTNLGVIAQTYYYRVLVWSTNGLANSGMGDLIYQPAYGQMVTNYPVAEGFENGSAHWAFDQPWALTTQISHSGATCLGSNPGTNYANNADSSAYLSLDLTKANRPMLSFWEYYAFEPNQDFGFVEVSLNQGANWTRLCALTGQSGTNWIKSRIPLDGYAGSQVLIRFRLKSDAQNPYIGWFIDDVQVQDFGVALGYPFFDNFDGQASQTNWVPSLWQQSPSGVTTNATDLGWRCLIGNGFQPGGDFSAYLTLSGTIDLSKSINPKLSFWWRAASQGNNQLYAQASTDGGKTWTSIWSWSSYWYQSAAWSWQQVDLNAYMGYTNFAFRFLAYQTPPGNPFGLDFSVDDVRFDEAPTDVKLSVAPGADPRHNAQLSWNVSTATNFAYYSIYRSTSPNVTPNNLLVTTLSNRATASFQDTSLPWVGQTYYYRILIWNTFGLHDWGANEVAYSSPIGQLVTNYPFAEGFENGDASWGLDQPWAITSEISDTGGFCLASSPGTNYANNTDASAYLSIDLAKANRPFLTFWQRYGFEPNRDFGFVEVSVNHGASWTSLYAVTGQSGSTWSKALVALDGYAGAQVLIRFRLLSDGQNPYDGWFIDDLQVVDFGALALTYPFYDSANLPASSSNWVASSWRQVPGGALGAGDKSWQCLVGNGYQPGPDLASSLTLAGTVDMTGAVKPQLWFSWRAGSQGNNQLYAQVSTDRGSTWNSVWTWSSYWYQSSAWTRQQVDLTSYTDYTNLALRFLAYQSLPGNPFGMDFSVDEILIAPGGGVPAILTDSLLPVATLGYAYSASLQATNGFLPYTWAVVSNSLPPWLTLDPVAGILSGTPTNAGNFNFWLSVTTSNNLSWQKQFTLPVQTYVPLYPTHAAQAFVSPGTNVVYCQVDNQTGQQLLSLIWVPTLPPGWTIVGVQGAGNPELGRDGNILFEAQLLTNNPLQFSYQVRVPAGETQVRPIFGAASFLLSGSMVNERTVSALPNPLLTAPRLYHSADCNTNWIIETSEASRVLAYWRAQSYHLDPTACDGYAPGPGSEVGPLHSADYRSPYWLIDGTEVNRILAYWRAGCYQPDTNGPDGYSAGCAGTGVAPHPAITHQAPQHFAAGSSFLVTNQLAYSGTLVSLLWRPVLPPGWAITNVIADGGPELVNGEMVWTGATVPPSPLHVLYFVQVPASERTSSQSIHDEVEYQALGMLNPLSAVANPDPEIITLEYVQFDQVQKLPNGSFKLSMSGSIDSPVRLLAAPGLFGPWTVLTNFPSVNAPIEYVVTPSTHVPAQFYRLVSP